LYCHIGSRVGFVLSKVYHVVHFDLTSALLRTLKTRRLHCYIRLGDSPTFRSASSRLSLRVQSSRAMGGETRRRRGATETVVSSRKGPLERVYYVRTSPLHRHMVFQSYFCLGRGRSRKAGIIIHRFPGHRCTGKWYLCVWRIIPLW
jgi:hypothetical protein